MPKKENPILDEDEALELLAMKGDKDTLQQIFMSKGIPAVNMDEYMDKLVDSGLIHRPIAIPSEETLRRLGWTLIVILIKLDLTQAYGSHGQPLIWIQMGRIVKALTTYMANEFDDFKTISIATPIGWRYDLVVIAYSKAIGKGFSEFASKITTLLPCSEVVTHPFASLYEFHPAAYRGPERVWDELAGDFDRYITRTEIEPLLKFIEAEKLYLDKVIAKSEGDLISLAEVGSGTGRLLLRYLSKEEMGQEYDDRAKSIIPDVIGKKLNVLVGIECSEKMVKATEQNLERLKLMKHLNSKLFLFRCRGDYLRYSISRSLSDPKSRALTEQGFWDNPRIVCNMLNTLGIMKPSIRKSALLEMKELAGPDGKVVLSVFDAEYFEKGVEKIYTPLKRLVGDFSMVINIDWPRKVFTTERGYYSHWFQSEEITRLIEEVGLSISGKIEKNPVGFSMYMTLVPQGK